MRNSEMTQGLSSKSMAKDNIRYFLILCTIFLILLNLNTLFISRVAGISLEDPWQRTEAFFFALSIVMLAAFFWVFLTLICGLLATFFTVFNFLRRNNRKFRKKRDYFITLGIGCVLLILMIGIPIGTQIRTTTIQNSYIQSIQQNNKILTSPITVRAYNFTAQPLGFYSFQSYLTYMYIIAIEDKPLPTKAFDLHFSFHNSSFTEPLEQVMHLDHIIYETNLRNSLERTIDSTNYYIVTDHRLFFYRQFSNDSTINCNLTCTVYQYNLIEFQIKLILLEDPSDTIRKGVIELFNIGSDPTFAFWLAIPSVLIILNSLVFILKYPKPKTSQQADGCWP